MTVKMMKHIKSYVSVFGKDTKGVTAIQYGLIAAFIGVGTIGAVTTTGGELETVFGGLGKTILLSGETGYFGEGGTFTAQDFQDAIDAGHLVNSFYGLNSLTEFDNWTTDDSSLRFLDDQFLSLWRLPDGNGGYAPANYPDVVDGALLDWSRDGQGYFERAVDLAPGTANTFTFSALPTTAGTDFYVTANGARVGDTFEYSSIADPTTMHEYSVDLTGYSGNTVLQVHYEAAGETNLAALMIANAEVS